MKQSQALDILKTGENVFLTGSAGAGKTHVLNQYIQYLKERKVPVAVTASTGIAATHMNGMTIHAWSGMGVKDRITKGDLNSMKTKKYLKDQLDKSKVLIIDEISMLHLNQLNSVNTILQHFKQNGDAFGSIQVVFSGDFFQLPPVGNEPNSKKFAFMSPAWLEANLTICYLTEQYRQTGNELNEILNEVRSGGISARSRQLLESAANTTLTGKGVLTRLYTHNYDVDTINNKEINMLTGQLRIFNATTKGNDKLIASFKKSVQASETIILKEGAKVMFVKNNPDKGYINGSIGEVIRFSDEGMPVVKLMTGKTITTEQESWSIENDKGKELATYKQIPLRLAWAITVHKSQGMTLDAAEIDLSKTFEKGQGYVAISRLKDLKNLRLIGFNETAIKIDSLALKADKRFQELSDDATKFYKEEEELERRAKCFVEYCGGITSEKEIAKLSKKLKQKKSTKSTYELTKELVLKGLTISEIGYDRGMTEGTIIGHIEKLKVSNPEISIEMYKPDLIDFEFIQDAHAELKAKLGKQEKVKLIPLYRALNGSYNYEEIRQAMLFL
ncbi:MAG: AAA family ATPase [Flavobacteriales bacterium]|nr:AAA family ATPase [Flavobacteriales bacterium]